jgi:DNA invertase Pin-like site-specific DNA recombinase
MNRRAFSYLRLSNPEQARGHGLERQLEATRKYAVEKGWELQEEMQEVGVSAFRGLGGKFGAFVKLASEGKLRGSVLIVESLDRMSREEVKRSAYMFLGIINAGVAVVTLVDGRTYEPENTEMPDIMYAMMVLMRAHDESKTKSIRVASAWAKKRANAGKKAITARCPGWLRLENGRFVVHEDRARIIRTIFDDARSMGIFTIVRRLNARGTRTFGSSRGWTNSYVAKLLRSRATNCPDHC